MRIDAPEFRSVFEREFTYVWNTLRRLGIKERDLPDVTQDVFLTVHQLLDDFDPSRPVRPWLFGIAYRIALRFRALARHSREVLGEERDAVDPARAPDEEVEAQQARALAHAAIGQIEIHRRAAFLLHEIDGTPVPEIAAVLALPLNTAYSRLRLARQDFANAVHRLQRMQQTGKRSEI